MKFSIVWVGMTLLAALEGLQAQTLTPLGPADAQVAKRDPLDVQGSGSVPTTGILSSGFIRNSSVALLLRNYADNATSGGVSRRAWAQSGRLVFQSGFTDGPVGLGVDASLFAAVKLDGGIGAGNLVHVDPDGGGQSRLAWAYPGTYGVKAKAGSWIVKYGLQMVSNPVLEPYDNRSLPPTFRGISVIGNPSPHVVVDLGTFDAVNARGHTTMQSLSSVYGRVRFDRLSYAGIRWSWAPDGQLTLYASQASRLWNQYYAALSKSTGSPQQVRWSGRVDAYRSRSLRDGLEGDIDTMGVSTSLAAEHEGSTVTVSYQQIFGNEFLDFTRETSALYLANSVGSDFNAPHEKSIQLRYTLNGTALGVPGFKLSVWGVAGWGANATTAAARYAAADSLLHNLYWKAGVPVHGRNHEFGLTSSYLIQDTSLKNTRLSFSVISHVNSAHYLGDSYREFVFTMNRPIELR